MVSNIDQPRFRVSVYAAYDRPKEAFMGGHPFPEIPCTVCRKPVDLSVDLYADEHGKAVHENCYVTRMLVTQWQESKIVL